MKKIYLGEDTPTQAIFLKGILNREPDLDPVVFGDGLDLYLAILAHPPSLIISDNILPSLDGLALARLIKFHEETQNIPFILVSSMSEEQIGDLKESGVNAYLSKPLNLPKLRELIRSLLASPISPSVKRG